jgi:TRAP-type mannitol/chloroaromatic compound transport system substrate-binding protein
MASQSGVKFIKTPESVLKAQLQAWDRVAERRSRENPVFARVLESQRSFARRAVRWSLDTQVDETMAFEHFFGKS